MEEYAARRGSARLPIGAAIRLRYPGVDEVFDETIGDIGMAGMFVQSDSPMPAGTLMHFELRPSPQWRTLRGRGRVVWARHQATEPDLLQGMGVRFIELDERARRGIRWLIETYQSVGDKPFETWTIPEQFARSGGALPLEENITQKIEPLGPPPAAPAERRPPWPWLAAGLVVLIGLGWFLRGSSGPAPEPVAGAALDAATSVPPAPTPDPEPVAGGPGREPIDGGGTAAALPTAETEPVAVAETTVPTAAGEAAVPALAEESAPPAELQLEPILGRLVDEWAAAWSSQDPERYLAFYGEDFVPEGELTREAWRSQRRQRLRAPSFVRVQIEDAQVLEPESDTPRTVFTQIYESDTFSDRVTKSLTWARREGAWRILRERSAP